MSNNTTGQGRLTQGTIFAKNTDNIGATGTYVHPSGGYFLVESDTTGTITGVNDQGRLINAPVVAGSVTRGCFQSVDATTTRANGSAALATAILLVLPV